MPATSARAASRSAARDALALVAALVAASAAPDACAALRRTFVASYGNDANVCSPAQPCRTFATALAKTADGGEIVALDSGGYGALDIAQSVTVTAPAGVRAAVSASIGSAVTVDGPSVEVVLRGLAIVGGSYGIDLSRAYSLTIERSEVSGSANAGIGVFSFAGPVRLVVRDTTITGAIGGAGISAGGAGTFVAFDRVRITRNHSDGMHFGGDVAFSVRDTLVEGNGGAGIAVDGYEGDAVSIARAIAHSEIVGNGSTGIVMNIGTTGHSSLVVSDTEIVRNNTAALAAAGGVVVDPNAALYSNANVTLIRTTILGNGGFGVRIARDTASALIDGCAVVGNGDFGLRADGFVYTRGNNVVHGNANGDFLGGTLLPYGGQ